MRIYMMCKRKEREYVYMYVTQLQRYCNGIDKHPLNSPPLPIAHNIAYTTTVEERSHRRRSRQEIIVAIRETKSVSHSVSERVSH